jgi:hypothetical protein
MLMNNSIINKHWSKEFYFIERNFSNIVSKVLKFEDI